MPEHCRNGIHCQTHACICRCQACKMVMAGRASDERACVYIGIHVTPGEKVALRALALSRQSTMSEVLRTALREHLKTLDTHTSEPTKTGAGL